MSGFEINYKICPSCGHKVKLFLKASFDPTVYKCDNCGYVWGKK